MLFYFSGTGNSQWVAQTLAELLGDQAKSIFDGALPDLSGEAQVGLVFPIHAWGVPEPMLDFAGKLDKGGAFGFAVATCGSDAGLALKRLARVFPLDSSYSLAMPNNYVLGSDLEPEAEVLRKIQAARQELSVIAGEIAQRKPTYRVHQGSMAFFKTYLVHQGFTKFAQRTDPFSVTDRCNGCGLCAAQCPAGTITLVDGKPTWHQKCYQCLRCINACPQRAIEYGEGTKTRGRYTIWKYLK